MILSRFVKTAAFALPLLAITLISAGCNGGGPAPSGIVIGEYGAMTGEEATFGTSTDKGVQMAITEANAKGGVNGEKVAVKLYDDQGIPDQAKTVVTKLIQQDGVCAVIGEVASSNSLQAAPECQKSKVPMITPASTNAKVTQQGDYIFRTCFIDPFQGGVMASFAMHNLKAKTAAVLTDSSQDYSKGLAAAFKATFTKMGGKIVADEAYGKGALDYHSQLSTIKAANPDVLFVPGYYNNVGAIGRTARSVGVKVPLLGGDGWDSDKLFEGAAGSLEGCYFSNHYSIQNTDPKVQAFVAQYKKDNAGESPDAMAALGYDATRILLAALAKAGKPADGSYTSDAYRAKLRDAIAATKDFDGVTGKITLGADRNAIKPAVVLEIKGNERKYVSTVKPEEIPT
ncbi:MAG TPA: ABC transporter substrate-binding protein [Capsulimonadaceae bacterium]|jgi:branched-chain amino acid transport system substrate-binding protein